MDLIKHLGNAELTARFQRFCGVVYDPIAGRCDGRGKAVHSGGTFEKLSSLSKPGDTYNRKYNTEGNQSSKNCDQLQEWTDKSKYTIKYRLLLHIFTLSSSLGNEAFYLMFYPACMWNCDSLLIRQTATVWCLCMYVGQATKDYLMLPRPASPPVVRLETFYLQEYAMPSTHAMSATAIPVMLTYLISSRYQVSLSLLIVGAVIYCGLICLSRLYLGVHSVLDILVGILLSMLLMAVTIPYIADFDLYQQTHPFAPIVIFISSLAMCTVLYPSNKDLNSYTYNTQGDAVQIVSVVAGVSFGAWANYQLGFTSEIDNKPELPFIVEFPTLIMIAVSVVRFFVGTVIVFLLQFILKKPLIRLFSYLFGLEKPDKRHPHVVVAYKFVQFYILGVAISFMIPFAHCMFGLERPSFFTEVI